MTNASRRGVVAGAPPGADFVQCLFKHLCDLSHHEAPEYLARINVLVPSRRMQRRLKSLFEREGNRLLPKAGLVTDVSHLMPGITPPKSVSKLRRLLELKAVVIRLVDLDPRLSHSNAVDLTASLTDLLDEMYGEGVSFDALEEISPDDQSGHWDQSLSFLRAIRNYVEALSEELADGEAIHRAQVEAVCARWSSEPPKHPIVVAGSTGSRATTQMLMAAVAGLPNGHVLLPGFDFDLTDDVWASLMADRQHEDHPQFRFADFLRRIHITPRDVEPLSDAPDSARNRLVSLSLRPAPVTHQWLTQGPALGDLPSATTNLSLIEAKTPKEEASAIALAIRSEIARDRSVALISPNATLARRVTAELKRWNVMPDDSGGMPLSLTPEGRFLRQTGRIAGGHIDPVEIVALLKHPLTRAGEDRGAYMKVTQQFELFLRENRLMSVGPTAIDKFAGARDDFAWWSAWLCEALEIADQSPAETLSGMASHHLSVLRVFTGPIGFVSIPGTDGGSKILELLHEFVSHNDAPGSLSHQEYTQLLDRALSAESVRPNQGVRPDVMIWGPLEARVQGAETVILGGLNEGVWPEQPTSDPWLNRSMRREAGLLLPERQIGLAAHDYQQAIGAERVILSRSARSDGAETVPSRWLSRLVNLLDGLKGNDGEAALDGMLERGRVFLDSAAQFDRPNGEPRPHMRPAPSPPVAIRPRIFAVTDIQRLIRDPYAIYAKRILQLKPINPLQPEMDVRLKGTVFHKILERFYHPSADFQNLNNVRDRFTEITRDVLNAEVPDAIASTEWKGQLDANFDCLFKEELRRREVSIPIVGEAKGRYAVPDSNFELRGTADRIDRLHGGGLVIYDYKTGTPPSHKDILHFDRQLVLEAVMAEHGAFEDVPAELVAKAVHLGVGRTPKEQITELTGDNKTDTIPEQLTKLLNTFLNLSHGYVPRRAMESLRFDGDYDHLARFGEWDESHPVVVEPVE